MKKISDVISKPVFKTNGQKYGYVIAVELSVDCTKLTSLIIVDDESETQAKIDASEIVYGKDAIFLKTEPIFVEAYNFSSPINKMVYDKNAKSLGRVEEVFLRSNKIVGISTNQLCFLPKNISVNGESAVILFGKKQKRKAFDFNLAKLQPEQYVEITEAQTQIVPYRVELTGKSLIGKIATRDILGLNNELIIKKHEVITQKKLNEAKRHNRLNLLFYNCK